MADSEANIKIKISQEGKQNLNEIDESFDSMIATAKKAAIAIAAVGAVIGKMALDAAKFDDVKKAFTEMAAQQGLDAKTMLQNMKDLTAGTVSEIDLMKKANLAMLLGLPLDKFDEMLAIAKGAAKSTGESMDFMLSSIVTGLGRQSKLILDNLGIMVDVDKAYRDFGATVGKTAEKLTEAEKKQAFINEAMKVGMENLQKMGGLIESTTDKWERFKANTENASASLGHVFGPIVNQVLDSMSSLGDWLEDASKSAWINYPFLLLSKALNDVGDGFAGLIDYALTLPSIFSGLGSAAVALGKIMVFDPSGAQKSLDESKAIFQKGMEDLSARRKATHDSWQEDDKALDEQYAAWVIGLAEQTTKTKNDKEKTEKKITIDEMYGYDAEKGDEEGNRRLRQLITQRDNARELAARESEENKARMAAEEAERVRLSEESNQKILLGNIEMGNQVFNFLGSGLEGVAKQGVVALTETFLPGFGAAAGQIFSTLTQDSEAFAKQLDQMFSVDFITNFASNLGLLVEKLPGIIENIAKFLEENAPDLIKHLIEAIIASMPEIVSALAKALITTIADPKFQTELTEAIVNGIVAGVKNAAGDIAEAIREGIKDTGKEITKATGIGSHTGGGGIGEKIGGFFGMPKWYHGNMFDAQIPRFAAGGIVDNTLAMVTPGEGIINKDSTAANAGLLSAINQSNGRSVAAGNTININVNGGMLGDEGTARQFARAIDEQLYKLRLGRESRAFDEGVT